MDTSVKNPREAVAVALVAVALVAVALDVQPNAASLARVLCKGTHKSERQTMHIGSKCGRGEGRA